MRSWKPGIYRNLPWAKYREIDLPSQSQLKAGLRSMKRLKRTLDGHCSPSPRTTATGAAVHAIIGGEFDQRIAVLPAFENDPRNVTKGTTKEPPAKMTKADGSLTALGERWQKFCVEQGMPEDYMGTFVVGQKQTNSTSTTFYRESKAAFEEANKHRDIITADELKDAQRTVSEIEACEPAAALLGLAEHEVTVIGEIEGQLCKTRIDLLIADRYWAGEIKTTNDVHPRAFYRTCKRLGYFFQFAFHNLLLASAGDDAVQLLEYDVIAAETQDDFDCGVINILPWSLIDDWGERVKRVVRDYRDAKASRHWPGLYGGPEPLEIPEYDMNDMVVFEE